MSPDSTPSAPRPVVLFATANRPGTPPTGPMIRRQQFDVALARESVVRVLLGPEDLPEQRDPSGDLVLHPTTICNPVAVAALVPTSPRAVIGAGSLMPVAAAARYARHVGAPLWADFFGDPLAELHAAQSDDAASFDPTLRDHVWNLMREALIAADAFSVVSGPQRHALLGQLALLGRLGVAEGHLQRIHEIPCAVPDHWTRMGPIPPYPALLRQRGFDDGQPYFLFSGSWNVWLDAAAIARIASGMLNADRTGVLRFVVAGIPASGAAERLRGEVLDRMAATGESSRVTVIESLGPEDEETLLAWAGACLLPDRDIPESALGSRNRALAMMRWGAIPVVSPHSELARDLVSCGLAICWREDDPEGTIARALGACRRDRNQREFHIASARRRLESVTFSRTTEPLMRWAASPARWPGVPATGLVDAWAEGPAAPHADVSPGGERAEGLWPVAWLRRLLGEE